MSLIQLSAYDVAQRFVGVREVAGSTANPQIMAMLKLDGDWPQDDAVPWCSAFVNYVTWLLRLPRSKSLRARSWLQVGRPIDIDLAKIGFDIVILKRGRGTQPGPDVIDAPGHVGFYAGRAGRKIMLLGGNQSDAVNVAFYAANRVLGVRRLFGW